MLSRWEKIRMMGRNLEVRIEEENESEWVSEWD